MIPPLALQLPTTEILIDCGNNLLLRVTVAQFCQEVEDNVEQKEIQRLPLFANLEMQAERLE